MKVFAPTELEGMKGRLSDFLFEIALQIQARLPDNVKNLKNVSAVDPRNILGGNNLQALCEVAISFQSLGINVSSIEAERGRLRHTSLGDTNSSTPLVKFWTSVSKLGTAEAPLFPHLTKLVSILICLPTSNATVERLFSVMGVIKTKLRNRLAIPMVEGILATRYGLKRRNETCANMIILPSMLAKFNLSMYSYKVTEPQGQRDIVNANADSQEADAANENADIVEVLNDVEALLGEPIFITN